MDLTVSQAADQAATILQGLDADTKKAGDQAAVARAWLDLARYLPRAGEQHSIGAAPLGAREADPPGRLRPLARCSPKREWCGQ
jgi:hypothetical protein